MKEIHNNYLENIIMLDNKASIDSFDPDKFLSSFNEKKKEEKYNQSEDFLGNVEKGKEMTFTEADSGNVNPNFDESEGFQCNCQTCVVVFEARLRGWNIEARPYKYGSNADLLSQKTNLAWLDEKGEHPSYIYDVNANSTDAMYNFISETVKPGERYTLEGIWKGPWGCGHIISVFRESSGNLVFYDPQVNLIYNEKGVKEKIIQNMQKGDTEDSTIKLLRIDDKHFDKQIVDSIVRGTNYV